MKNLRAGFTLIELIVVIAIIALLSSIVMAGLSDARTKARNASVMQQVHEYQTAVSLYIINHQNRYPDVGDIDMHCVGSGDIPCLWVGVEIEPDADAPLTDLEPYIRGLPFVNTDTLGGVGTYRGLLYQCNDADCRTANFYWPEFNVGSCSKGTEHDFIVPEGEIQPNGVLCTQLAEGSVE